MNIALKIIIITCISISFIHCKKDKLLTNPSATIAFSQDSILFDTVFTTIGSTTRQLRVINKNNQKINISSVRLQQGQASNFIINVDGSQGNQINDVEILAKDSIYIFVQVNVNPNNANSPLVIQDKILFDVNGNQQSVALEAWGQDAYYHFPDKAIQFKNGFLPYSTISSITTQITVNWPNDKPHVIYGWLVVDTAQTLKIDAGVKVYFHKNAGLWVYRYGTLQVNGTYGNEVVFQGDRRENDYADLPGQWDRIWINEGSDKNYINYAIIKNSFIGLQTDIINYDVAIPTRKLRLTNTKIQNCSKYGLYSTFYNIWAANNVISNCKEYCAALTLGGNYTFLHTTFANYFNKEGGRGGQPCVYINNYNDAQVLPLDSCFFGYSIIDGSTGNELSLDIKADNTFMPKVKFANNVLKTTAFTNTLITHTGNVFGGSLNFVDASNYNFAINAGSVAKEISNDFSLQLNYASIIGSDIKTAVRTASYSAGAYNPNQ